MNLFRVLTSQRLRARPTDESSPRPRQQAKPVYRTWTARLAGATLLASSLLGAAATEAPTAEALAPAPVIPPAFAPPLAVGAAGFGIGYGIGYVGVKAYTALSDALTEPPTSRGEVNFENYYLRAESGLGIWVFNGQMSGQIVAPDFNSWTMLGANLDERSVSGTTWTGRGTVVHRQGCTYANGVTTHNSLNGLTEEYPDRPGNATANYFCSTFLYDWNIKKAWPLVSVVLRRIAGQSHISPVYCPRGCESDLR